MKTYLLVNVALLPLPIYLLVTWLVSPLFGAGAALAYALGWSVFVRGAKLPPVFECALIAGLGLILADRLSGAQPLVASANGALLLCLSAGAAVSIAMGKPWTAEFSASEYGDASRTPLFLTVNMMMSAIWAALFAWLGGAALLDAPAFAYWIPLALGTVISLYLPNVIVARALAKEAAGDQRNNWPAPDFSGAKGQVGHDEEHCDVAVIGSGLGGLTAAALLADAGLKVSVFEQHVVPGGYAHNWLRRARVRDPRTGEKLTFRFDSGVHDVSGWQPGGPVRSVFERLGIAKDCEWERLDHLYVLDGTVHSVSRDWRAYAGSIAKQFPHEADGIVQLFEDIHDIYRAMYSASKERGGIPGAPTTPDGLMSYAKAHPLAVEWMRRPWTEFVARHVTDEGALDWINLLSGYVTHEPEKAPVAQLVPLFGYYFEGGYYPVGGSGALGKSLVSAIERRGGKVHLRSSVLKITDENGTTTGLVVKDRRGNERHVRAGAVVCNGDLRLMLDTLLDDGSVASRLETQTGPVRPACSAVAIHVALRGELDLPPVVTVDGNAAAAGLVIPSAVDPSCAPKGYSTLEVIQLVAPEDAQTWFPVGDDGSDTSLASHRRTAAYLKRKKEAGDRLIDCAREVIPDIDERIVYRTDASPITYQRYTQTSRGSIYGVTTGADTVPTKTPLRNLVLAGAATHGPGVEAVVISGAYAAEALVPGILSATDDQARSPAQNPPGEGRRQVEAFEEPVSGCRATTCAAKPAPASV